MDRAAKLREIDQNYDAFQRQIGPLLGQRDGDYALLKSGEIVGLFARLDAASSEAKQRFPDGIYSIQQVVEDPVDLGFFSHAGS